MMKGNRMPFILGICTLLMCISCKKSIELVDDKPAPTDTETLSAFSASTGYRIKVIKGVSASDSAWATFFYNAAGNPDSIVFNPTPGSFTNRYNMHFRYDTLGRVSDYYTVYYGNIFFEWYHYQYDSAGRAIQDTLWEYGTIAAGTPTSSSLRYVINNTFDSLGRVVSTAKHRVYPSIGPVWVETFTYNTGGNLVRNYLPNVFDTETSLVSSHPVWQLVSKDYSINNQFLASSYNDAGLPLVLEGQGIFRFLTNVWLFPRIEITYE